MTPRTLAVFVALALAATTVACGDDDATDPPSTTPATPTSTPASTPASTSASTSASAPDAPATDEPTIEWPVIAAPSLEDNLLDDPAELDVGVWLPVSYATSTQDYPVVYFLAGFQEGASVTSIGSALQEAIEAGEAPEMIVVGVSGLNSLGGSFYVDSPVTGGWATAIHTDLVEAIDAQYRTIADPASRGIAGFSMGGFGALDLAMRHPDVFGAVYALSPGLFAPGGMETTQMFADPDSVADFLAMQDAIAAGEQPGPLSEGTSFARAYGSAFSPDVDAGPPWIAYPYDAAGSPPDPETWALWESGYGGIADEVAEFHDELSQLRGIAVDVGVNDPYEWIPEGARFYVDELTASGITAELTEYQGGHGPVSVRAGEVMIPFFARVLDAG